MADESLWIRLNVDYLIDDDDGPWLDPLPWPVKACWHVFLLHVKVYGNRRGVCPIVNPAMIARPYGIPVEDMKACIEAAIAAGALGVTDKSLLSVTNWAKTQTTDAARVRKAREHHRKLSQVVTDNADLLRTNDVCYEQPSFVTDKPYLSVTSAVCSDSLSRDSDSDSSINTAAAVLDSPLLIVTDNFTPPWWEHHEDELTAWIGGRIGAIPKYSMASRPATRERTERIVQRLRATCPTEDLIRAFVEEWAEFHTSDQAGRYGVDDPISSITRQIDAKVGLWAQVRQQLAKAEPQLGPENSRPSEGKDYVWMVRGNDTVRVDPTTRQPFDERAWYTTRNLSPPTKAQKRSQIPFSRRNLGDTQ